MKMKKSELTQERILDAAVLLIAEKGYAATTTSEIAKSSQVAEGTVFKYFPTKEAILKRAVYRFVDGFGKQVIVSSLEKIVDENKEDAVEELLKKIILDRLSLFGKYSEALTVLVAEMRFHDDLKQVFYSKVVSSAAEAGASIIELFKKKGIITDVNSFMAIRSLAGAVVMMAVQRKNMPELNAYESLEEEVDALINLYLYGIIKR